MGENTSSRGSKNGELGRLGALTRGGEDGSIASLSMTSNFNKGGQKNPTGRQRRMRTQQLKFWDVEQAQVQSSRAESRRVTGLDARTPPLVVQGPRLRHEMDPRFERSIRLHVHWTVWPCDSSHHRLDALRDACTKKPSAWRCPCCLQPVAVSLTVKQPLASQVPQWSERRNTTRYSEMTCGHRTEKETE